MITIRVSCFFCGVRELSPADLTVTVLPAGDAESVWDCQPCGVPIVGWIPASAVSILVAAGCELVERSPLPNGIQDTIDSSIDRVRRSATYDLEAAWHDILSTVDTLEDLFASAGLSWS